MLQKYLDLVQESPGVALTDLHLNAIFLETARSHHISEHTAKSIFDAYQAAHPDDCKPTAHTMSELLNELVSSRPRGPQPLPFQTALLARNIALIDWG